MNMAMRRGACPALSAPMQTGDGLLVRLSPAEGGMAPATLASLCGLAARHGNGIVEVTARGSLQLRGLTAASAPLLAAEAAALDLDLREGVPVETSPLAGLDPDEVADALPVVRAIRAAIATAGLASRLAPKVSVVVDGGGNVDLSEMLADIRLTARQGGGWLLASGGDAATATPLAVLDESDVAPAVVAALEAVAAAGRSARARELAGELEAVLSRFTRRGCGQEDESQGAPSRFAPALIRPSGPPPPRRRGEGIVAELPLADGRFAFAAALPFGSIHAHDLAAFARAAETRGIGEIRLAPGRALILLCPSAATARAMAPIAERRGLITDPLDPRRAIAACPGAPACAGGSMATRQIATGIAQEWRDLLDGSFDIHVSGCAKGCARPGAAALTLVGGKEGCSLVLDGTAAGAPLAGVAHDDALSALRRLAHMLRAMQREGGTAGATLRSADAAALASAFRKEGP